MQTFGIYEPPRAPPSESPAPAKLSTLVTESAESVPSSRLSAGNEPTSEGVLDAKSALSASDVSHGSVASIKPNDRSGGSYVNGALLEGTVGGGSP